MKFTTLLFLAAVAGALVYAEDASSDSTDADPAQEAGTSKPNEEISDPAASASPPETTTTAQETSAAVQGTAKVTTSRQELNPLKQAFARAGKGMPGGLAGGKQFIENGNEFAQKLLKKFGLPKPWA
ncbi:PREDICTED: extracellular glycoprotein lacritin isoform X2 [Mandrillus leucophaeus]|uniref:extracellular glycoprotein lacritin isoform X2 n=1 Tax=Mandrillus leucophaeus TaxID=9568 RepID=UPI0005F494DD|nr:PREDICTED: extracellular glycoprotein lacritin isoform X2 [Mandrillus leucophaeus]